VLDYVGVLGIRLDEGSTDPVPREAADRDAGDASVVGDLEGDGRNVRDNQTNIVIANEAQLVGNECRFPRDELRVLLERGSLVQLEPVLLDRPDVVPARDVLETVGQAGVLEESLRSRRVDVEEDVGSRPVDGLDDFKRGDGMPEAVAGDVEENS